MNSPSRIDAGKTSTSRRRTSSPPGEQSRRRRWLPHLSLEHDLNVHAVADDVLGETIVFSRRGKPEAPRRKMHRYEKGCRLRRCVTGCPNAAKQGMNVSYVPGR